MKKKGAYKKNEQGPIKYIRDGRAPIPEKEITSKIMSSIRGKDTTPEILLRKALFNNGLSGYRIHWKKIPGRPDICYPSRKVAIFVHGCYWHRCPYCKPSMPKTHVDFWKKKFKRNIKRDKRKILELENSGWEVLVFWECQIKEDINECLGSVKKILESK